MKQPAVWKPPSFDGLAGVARRDITPPVGIYSRQWGAARHDRAVGVHRPLTATALALQSRAEDPPLLLLALDLGHFESAEDEWSIRGGIVAALGLPSSHVIVNLSHTHAGPSLSRSQAEKAGGHLIAPYLETVGDTCIEIARAALRARRPAVITWGRGDCPLACNRDLPDPDTNRFLCGFNPAAPADATVVVGRVALPGGECLATIVNYACHPTTLAWENTLLSPDYVGAAREVVEAHTAGAPCLFLQGASGDLGPREQYQGDTAIADENGRRLGLSAVAALASLLPPAVALEYAGPVESGAPLATWHRKSFAPSTSIAAVAQEIALPLKPLPSLAEIEDGLRGSEDRVAAERLRRKHRVRRAVGDGPAARAGLWVWRVGEGFLVAQPNEAYSHLQTSLRRTFADHPIVVTNLSNGAAVGYLPPRELYGRDLYQVWQTPFGPGALEEVTRQSEQAIRDLLA